MTRPRRHSERLPRKRRGFSLIELMIAIVVLGLGMIMAASMFPVGWARARQLNEYTVQQNLADNVEAWLRLSGQAAGRTFDGAMFAGDLIWTGSDCQYIQSDTRVHALNAQNIGFGGGQDTLVFADEDPWELEFATDITDPDDDAANRRRYVTPQLPIGGRMYPPIRARKDADFATPDEDWDDAFADRRYCAAVFHRLRRDPGPVGNNAERCRLAVQDAEKVRSFDIYTVILRRAQSTHRFARQETVPANLPDPFNRAVLRPVRAKRSSDDRLLPTPWRVQLEFPNDLPVDDPGAAPEFRRTGTPTQVRVIAPTEADEFVFDMFQDGTQVIDEVNGLIYTINERRIVDDGASTREAVLTLDRELVVGDIDDGAAGNGGNGLLELEEQIRVVWVFPPPLQAGDRDSNIPIFDGPSPVVGIDLRTVHISP